MQFVGDEVFAVFGAPVSDEGAGVEALRCALELQDDVTTLDERLTAAGLPAIRFGVGVHRGCCRGCARRHGGPQAVRGRR